MSEVKVFIELVKDIEILKEVPFDDHISVSTDPNLTILAYKCIVFFKENLIF